MGMVHPGVMWPALLEMLDSPAKMTVGLDQAPQVTSQGGRLGSREETGSKLPCVPLLDKTFSFIMSESPLQKFCCQSRNESIH